MQSLACPEIEFFDRSRDGRRYGRAQSFLDRPKRLFFIDGLDQDDAGRIKTGTVEAVTVRAAMPGKPARRGDEQHRGALRRPAKNPAKDRRDKAEGRRRVAMGCGRDLVQGPAAQTALRQVRIEDRKTEGKRARFG